MKPMKAAMKKVMKVAMKKATSKIAKGKRARHAVFAGRKTKTQSGMTKDTLAKNKNGKVVSKKASANAKKAWARSPLKKWSDATKLARKALSITGFVPVGGKTRE